MSTKGSFQRAYPAKPWLDFMAAVAVGLVSLPVILICIAAIRLETRGPGIFRQVRVGQDGNPFVCYKLRSMQTDTANVPSHVVAGSAVTKVGRVLRRTKLDELPQVWNVLRAEMSFVGPRPCLPSQKALVESRKRKGVLALKPGITGVAQVAGVDMSDPERLAALDATYLERASLGTDLRLILATVCGAGRGDRVRPGA